MYEYRKMTPEQRAQIVAARELGGHPWHAPPHCHGENVCMLSAACFEHKHILTTPDRLTEFTEALISGFENTAHGSVHAWVVLPNHWHILGKVDLTAFGNWIARLHNGKSTQWNREDATPGRQVWFRYSDRSIRNERHFYASLNYIHGNPVKHGYVTDAMAWPWTSLHEYIRKLGRDQLVEWWQEYPVKDYGKGWDD